MNASTVNQFTISKHNLGHLEYFVDLMKQKDQSDQRYMALCVTLKQKQLELDQAHQRTRELEELLALKKTEQSDT